MSRYGLELLAPPRGLQEGNRSATVIVETSAGKKVLRGYSERLRVDTIQMEHSVLRQLAACDFPCPRLVLTETQESLVHHEDVRYGLFDFIDDGFHYYHYVFLPAQTRSILRTSGALLGRMHAALESFEASGCNPDGFDPRSGQRERDLPWLFAKLARCVETSSQRSPSRHAAVERMLTEANGIRESLETLDRQLSEADLPRCIIHADYGPYNLLWRRTLSPVVLDFEMVRLDWRLVDLIRSWHRFCHDRRGFRWGKLENFTMGYSNANSLDPREVHYAQRLWRFLSLKDAVVEWERWSQGDSARPPRRLEAELRKVDWIEKHGPLVEKRLKRCVEPSERPTPAAVATVD